MAIWGDLEIVIGTEVELPNARGEWEAWRVAGYRLTELSLKWIDLEPIEPREDTLVSMRIDAEAAQGMARYRVGSREHRIRHRDGLVTFEL